MALRLCAGFIFPFVTELCKLAAFYCFFFVTEQLVHMLQRRRFIYFKI